MTSDAGLVSMPVLNMWPKKVAFSLWLKYTLLCLIACVTWHTFFFIAQVKNKPHHKLQLLCIFSSARYGHEHSPEDLSLTCLNFLAQVCVSFSCSLLWQDMLYYDEIYRTLFNINEGSPTKYSNHSIKLLRCLPIIIINNRTGWNYCVLSSQ